MKVQFTASARVQFLEAVEFIRRDKLTAARRFRTRVETSLRRLERFPESGRLIPEFPDVPHRELVIGSYRFFYRVEKRIVWVVAVWHGSQRTSNPAEREIA